MSARHGSSTWPGGGETSGEGSSLAAVRDSEALVDLLASRVELADIGEDADPLAVALAGWVRTLDAEVATAMAGRPRVPAGPTAGYPAGRVLPVVGGRGHVDARHGRGPWWALSASAAAVIAVLTVGVGLQDAAQVGPSATVAESVQSVEATLTASLLAAESGDVAGARVLLEQARALVAQLPEAERTRWEEAVGRAEQGLRTAEEAVRAGQPVPDLDGRGPGEQGRGTQDERGEGRQAEGGPEDGGPGEGGATTPDARPAAPGAPAATAPAPRPTTASSPTATSPTATSPTAPRTNAPAPSPTSPTAAPTPTAAPDEPGDQGRRPSPSTGPGATPGVGQGTGQGAGQGSGQGRRPSEPAQGPGRVP